MNDRTSQPPYIYDGLDPAPETKSAISEVSDAVKGAASRVSGAIESGRKPGMPLSILTNIAREAPLGSLLAAFLLGVAFARRR
jgi:hypothetical protein